MLVLGRKVGEKIYIGENVCVTVLEVKGERIRLGFEAGKEIPIHRAEIAHQIVGKDKIIAKELEHTCADGKSRGRTEMLAGDCRMPDRSSICAAS